MKIILRYYFLCLKNTKVYQILFPFFYFLPYIYLKFSFNFEMSKRMHKNGIWVLWNYKVLHFITVVQYQTQKLTHVQYWLHLITDQYSILCFYKFVCMCTHIYVCACFVQFYHVFIFIANISIIIYKTCSFLVYIYNLPLPLTGRTHQSLFLLCHFVILKTMNKCNHIVYNTLRSPFLCRNDVLRSMLCYVSVIYFHLVLGSIPLYECVTIVFKQFNQPLKVTDLFSVWGIMYKAVIGMFTRFCF
jgi:hypothetical protein